MYKAQKLSCFIIWLYIALSSCSSGRQKKYTESPVRVTEEMQDSTHLNFVGLYAKGKDYQELRNCENIAVYQLKTETNILSKAYDSLTSSTGQTIFVRILAKEEKEGSIEPIKIIEASKWKGQQICQPEPNPRLVFNGNEPFWSLKISADSIVFNHFEEPKQYYQYHEPEWKDTAWVYETQNSRNQLSASLSMEDCYDDMSGKKYSMRIEVRSSIGTFTGCGGPLAADTQ
ncbi:hypothetical protein PZB74_19200 [Porifericola rhodea]|uniref:COG3650 family protein n=1 Tax=Porifericola rhodea TaxID=930972 RepID=UPI00266615A2|nr:hypothetical protein [Porifericola rhodea]WKN31080.1 hypothetical protein PZB74_19200 [Porifericola rhodea]